MTLLSQSVNPIEKNNKEEFNNYAMTFLTKDANSILETTTW